MGEHVQFKQNRAAGEDEDDEDGFYYELAAMGDSVFYLC